MVKAIFEDIKKELNNVDVKESSYEERGYHLAIDASLTDIVAIVKFFNTSPFVQSTFNK